MGPRKDIIGERAANKAIKDIYDILKKIEPLLKDSTPTYEMLEDDLDDLNHQVYVLLACNFFQANIQVPDFPRKESTELFHIVFPCFVTRSITAFHIILNPDRYPGDISAETQASISRLTMASPLKKNFFMDYCASRNRAITDANDEALIVLDFLLTQIGGALNILARFKGHNFKETTRDLMTIVPDIYLNTATVH